MATKMSLNNKAITKRRPVVRAPSRLYRILDPNSSTPSMRKKNMTTPTIIGPEFVVRSKENPKILSLISKQSNQVYIYFLPIM